MAKSHWGRQFHEDQSISRFKHYKPRPNEVVPLAPTHPAVVEGRTLFPTTVVSAEDSPRVLVSGHNNPKLGRRVLKGPRAGWPIYHLTLEERKTCPSSCFNWTRCYGNGMHMARRHRAGRDLELKIMEEVSDLALDHPEGFVVRLHTLGDFYSVGYVKFWGRLIDAIPQLHVFGFTSRLTTDLDSKDIAEAILDLTSRKWDRFAIRFSRPTAGAQGATVVTEVIEGKGIIMCPAQTEKTGSCGSCGICWASATKGSAIAFLLHGSKKPGDSSTWTE